MFSIVVVLVQESKRREATSSEDSFQYTYLTSRVGMDQSDLYIAVAYAHVTRVSPITITWQHLKTD